MVNTHIEGEGEAAIDPLLGPCFVGPKMVLSRMVLFRPLTFIIQKDPAWSGQANQRFEKLCPES